MGPHPASLGGPGVVWWSGLHCAPGCSSARWAGPLSASRCSSSQRGRTLAVTFLVTFLGGSRVPR